MANFFDQFDAKPSLDPRSREFAIRTVLGEAANEPDEGMAGVAAVIKNRIQAGRYGGNDVMSVVRAPSQFEPWGTAEGQRRMYGYRPDSEAYKRAGAVVDRVFGEGYDPTSGATHFYSPSAQAALGRQAPKWAQGEPLNIGRHSFYAPEGRVGSTEVSAQSRQPAGNFFDQFDSPAQPDVSSRAPATSPPDVATMADTGGRFTDNPGQNFRTAREGVSEPPKSFTDKLMMMWENPPKDRLSMIGMIKSAYEAAKGVGEVASGQIPVTDENGNINPEVIERTTNLAMVAPLRGAPGGVLARPVAASESLVANVAKPSVAAPSAAELKAAAKAGFESEAVKSLEVAPRAVSELGQGLRSRLNEAGIDENLAPKTFGLLNKLDSSPAEAVAVTGANLQSMRRAFQHAAASPDKTERLAASRAIEAIDEFIPNVAARDILSGDPRAAAQAWATARGNYAAAMRSDEIAKALIKAQRQAESAGSGANIDNATRQQFKAILNNEKRSRGFNDEELAAMEAAVKGTTWGNFARLVGKAAPTGIVSGALSGGAGLAAGGPLGAVLLPVAGLIGKSLGDRSTTRSIQALDELVRSRAPLMKAFEDAAAKQQAIAEQGQTAKTMSAMAIASRNLASNLRDAGFNIAPSDIMRSLQGGVQKSAADDDQQQQ